MSWWNFAPKPSVAEQRVRAAREARRLAKGGRKLAPVVIDGRTIARRFWGKAWCDNLESYRDYEYRLPRGRSYVRNGAVLHLDIQPGRIAAVVSGTDLYDVEIKIRPVAVDYWARIQSQCAGHIGSLIELLEGRLSDRVMQVVAHRERGLFPKPAEITMKCSCPDWATMCKHVAAAMYGVGARFDERPELLFTLRKVDSGDLIARAADIDLSGRSTKRKTLEESELGSVFGIEIAEAPRRRGKIAPKAEKAVKAEKAEKAEKAVRAATVVQASRGPRAAYAPRAKKSKRPAATARPDRKPPTRRGRSGRATPKVAV